MVNRRIPPGYYRPSTEPGHYMGRPIDPEARRGIILPQDSRVPVVIGESPMPKKGSGRTIKNV